MENESFDLLVAGGGINGAGIARDAALRGLRVALCERADLGQGTSSHSSGLIHGGLRYLESYEVRLVHESLRERSVLSRTAAHLVRPLRFVLPHVPGLRPAWIMRAGLLLYDLLGGAAELPRSGSLRLRESPLADSMRESLDRAWTYSDCRTDDARLVVTTVAGAARAGAAIQVGAELVAARRDDSGWNIDLRDEGQGGVRSVRARALVNAAGPWVAGVRERAQPGAHGHGVRLVLGSHIVVRRFWPGDNAFLLQNPDGRVVFVIPWPHALALVGTTDIAYEGDPAAAQASNQEIAYLCEAVNRQMRVRLGPGDVLHRFAGVRCLVDDRSENPSRVSRDYLLELEADRSGAPLLSVLGGKITTYRHLAEKAVDRLEPWFPRMGRCRTGAEPLPGSECGPAGLASERERLLSGFRFVPTGHLADLFDRHGTVARALLEGCRNLGDLGRHFGAGLYEIEAEHARRNEWAKRAGDVLWRRTKAGLGMSENERERFREWWSR